MKIIEGYQPKEEFSKNALIDRPKYQEMYTRSVESPEAFWESRPVIVCYGKKDL